MNFDILGKSWIIGDSHGSGSLQVPLLPGVKPLIPRAEELFSEPFRRYGRFDKYTRLGCAGIALALKEANLMESGEKRDFGLVISTAYECYESDLSFYASSEDAGGSLASPNKFTYTLPGIVTGECAIYFKLTGPTFCVGESFEGTGREALQSGLDLLSGGSCQKVVAGWLDYPPESEFLTGAEKDLYYGAVFVVMAKAEETEYSYRNGVIYKNQEIIESVRQFF